MKAVNINRRWFSMKADETTAEISIFDEIGAWGVNASDFKKEYDAIKDRKEITLLLNSPGGDVFAGMTIYNILAPQKEKISVKVLGLAASISSVIALAGKSMIMGEGAYFMIHNPWAITMGTAQEIRQTADLLDSIGSGMADIYTARSNSDREEILSLMEEETWMTAEEAREAGFADSIEETAEVAALACDLSKFKFQHAPKALIENAKRKAPPPMTKRDFEKFLRDGGYSNSESRRITAKIFSTSDDAGSSEEMGSGNEPKGENVAAPIWSAADSRALFEAQEYAKGA